MTAKALTDRLEAEDGSENNERANIASVRIHDTRDEETRQRHMREAMDIVMFGMGSALK